MAFAPPREKRAELEKAYTDWDKQGQQGAVDYDRDDSGCSSDAASAVLGTRVPVTRGPRD